MFQQETNKERCKSSGDTAHPGISHCQESKVDNHKQPDSGLSSRDQRRGQWQNDMGKRRNLSKKVNYQEKAHLSDWGYQQSPQGILKLNKDIFLTMDVFSVNKILFLITFTWKIDLTATSH